MQNFPLNQKLWQRLQPCGLYLNSFVLVDLCALAAQFLDLFLHWVGVVSSAGWSAGQSRPEPPDSGQIDSPPTQRDRRRLPAFKSTNPDRLQLISLERFSVVLIGPFGSDWNIQSWSPDSEDLDLPQAASLNQHFTVTLNHWSLVSLIWILHFYFDQNKSAFEGNFMSLSFHRNEKAWRSLHNSSFFQSNVLAE